MLLLAMFMLFTSKEQEARVSTQRGNTLLTSFTFLTILLQHIILTTLLHYIILIQGTGRRQCGHSARTLYSGVCSLFLSPPLYLFLSPPPFLSLSSSHSLPPSLPPSLPHSLPPSLTHSLPPSRSLSLALSALRRCPSFVHQAR